MKVLFTSFPGLGHFLPVVPLAWALRAAGHEVLVVTTGQAVEASNQAGLPTVDASPGLDLMAIATGSRGKDAAKAFRGDPFSGDNMARTAEWMSEVSNQMADRTIQTARAWKPDLIVHTPLDAIGPLAAALLSIPSVVQAFGILSFGSITDFVNLIYETVRPAGERNGVSGGPARPAAVIETCPPSMQQPDHTDAWFVRYVPYNGGGELPDWLLEPPSRPRICVTLGTVIPNVAGLGALGGVIEAVRDLDAEVILALGGTDPSALGVLPPNVRAAGWIPLSALVPTCSAVVHHGGSGTMMSAVAAGVPQLVLPHGADQHMNAAAVKERGLGLTHLPEDADMETVRSSLKQLLGDPGFNRAAQEVKEENESRISPAGIIPRLLELAVRV
jgi:UDP:flavonoid glycosyltransferase YjiC (YdhE family)